MPRTILARTTARKVGQHTEGKIYRTLLEPLRPKVYNLHIEDIIHHFYTIFGYFWLNLFLNFYFRKSVWLESFVGLFRQNLVQWALELGQFECWARISPELV